MLAFNQSRLEREKKTIGKMIHIYCKQNHNSNRELCIECQELLKYAYMRLDNCKFGDEKSSCGKCRIHCYKPDMRKKVVDVMKYAGPRMTYTHPILALYHLFDGTKR